MENEPRRIDPYQPPERPAAQPAGNVLELLDRILDKGLVIVGDIRVSVADIELLKIQIRLLIASVDKAKELGIDFSWAKQIEQPKTKEELERKIEELEAKVGEQEGTAESEQVQGNEDLSVTGAETEEKEETAEAESLNQPEKS